MESLSNGEVSRNDVPSETKDNSSDEQNEKTLKDNVEIQDMDKVKELFSNALLNEDISDKHNASPESVSSEGENEIKELCPEAVLESDPCEPMDVDNVDPESEKCDTKIKQSKDLTASDSSKKQLPNDIEASHENGMVENEVDSVSNDKTSDSRMKNESKEPSSIEVEFVKENTIHSEAKSDTIKEVSSVSNDITCSKGTIVEMNKTNVENTSKNHLMSGGSIISCNESNPKKAKTSKINDIAKKLLGENSSKLSSLQTLTTAIEGTLSKNSESTNTSNLSANKADEKHLDIDPLKKLNEHLKSIGIESTAIPVNKQSLSSSITPEIKKSSITVTEVTDLQSANKENTSTDTPILVDRLKDESSDNLVFADLTNEETGFPEIFSGLVKVGKYIAVKGDFTLRSTEALLESTSHVSPYLLKEPDVFPPKDKDAKNEPIDFFHSVAGEVLIGIGISRVNEWFHRDMVRIKKRQIKKSGKTPELEKELSMHENMYIESKKANSIYTFNLDACKTCGFSTESSTVMEGHLLIPHVTPKREYQCNFCDEITKDPKSILEHMKNTHRKIGRVQPPASYFECPFCSFGNNSKVKLNNHLTKCQRFFNLATNQAPAKDFEFPALTPKPITVSVVKAYEKSLGSMHRGRGRPKKEILDPMFSNQFNSNFSPNQIPGFRASSNSPLADSLSLQNQLMTSLQMSNMNLRPAHSNAMGHPLTMPSTQQYFQVLNASGQGMSMFGTNHLLNSPHSPYPNLNTSLGKNNSIFNSMLDTSHRMSSQDSASGVTITPLPKLQGPYPVPMAKPSSAPGISNLKSGLVVCEICDGYIKDLEQLRTHMQLIHKVKIHPKMLVSRPPLNCQKCQWRFFTDQGLERHLLGAHGLVTSNMQELANKGKDAGCCTICGRVYASKLVNHMNQNHKITLKPAHLSYKCTVCSATFNLYRLFENHVYLVHSGAAKRAAAAADGRSSPSKKLKSLSDNATDDAEKTVKCKTCGIASSQREICEKCLNLEKTSNGSLTKKSIDVELKKDEKTLKKVAT